MTGGYIYRGAHEEWDGKYIFGDWSVYAQDLAPIFEGTRFNLFSPAPGPGLHQGDGRGPPRGQWLDLVGLREGRTASSSSTPARAA